MTFIVCVCYMIYEIVTSIWYQNPICLLKFSCALHVPKEKFRSYNSERSNYSRILSIMQGTLLHSYGFAYVKLKSMMQIYLYEMPTNLLASNETNVFKWKRQPNSKLDEMFFIHLNFFGTSLVCVVT